MRSYVPVSLNEIQSLVSGESISPSPIFCATSEHRSLHLDLDEEEWEHSLSQEAAEAALTPGGSALVAVFESESESNFTFDDLQCIFQCERADDGEVELMWFGPTEIPSQLNVWVVR